MNAIIAAINATLAEIIEYFLALPASPFAFAADIADKTPHTAKLTIHIINDITIPIFIIGNYIFLFGKYRMFLFGINQIRTSSPTQHLTFKSNVKSETGVEYSVTQLSKKFVLLGIEITAIHGYGEFTL